MKAEKVTVTITVEALSIDCLKGLLSCVVEQVQNEAESGHLAMADGDVVHWETTRTPVDF